MKQKLTKADVAGIRRAWEDGWSQKDLAWVYGVSVPCINRIARRKARLDKGGDDVVAFKREQTEGATK